ncbi:hypothetical protein AAP_05327 [Ascosphaera apis ARSEF 7405]|uniref:DUF7707 domain-containing protein n=1 Tax=Ascosphaera apis ARSEF 7405 TaxID=392613 RepID=A0A162I2P0_9EURO|nr:hypothetical protein AAP_05327 [Ascosphaera apis ARSEF 7405]
MVRPTTAVLFAAASLAASVSSAQNFEIPAGFNAGIVPDSDKTSWCQGQLSSCPKICPDGVASKNTCNPTTLSFNCVCGDGSTPNVAEYRNTLPFFVCEENFGQCINAHPNDLTGQKECKSQRQQYCGTKKVPSDDDENETDDDSTTSTTAAATSASASSSSNNTSSSGAKATSASTTKDKDESSAAAATSTTLATKTRTTASATGKTAAKSPSSTASSATATSTAATESNAAVAANAAPYGVAVAALIAGLL